MRFPLIEEVPFVSPISLFEILEGERYSFLLDSGEGLGRYSFLGVDPFLVVKSSGAKIEIEELEYKRNLWGDPFEVIREISNRFRLNRVSALAPFQGGGVGYFGYDLYHFIEDLPSNQLDDLGAPDCIFCFYDIVLVFDLKLRKCYILSSGFPDMGRLGERRAAERLRILINKLSSFEKKRGWKEKREAEEGEIYSNFTKDEYIRAIKTAKEYIKRGEIYQVNLSQRLTSSLPLKPFELYKRLRTLNPAPFASFLNFEDVMIASSSPERFLRLVGREVETRPIKGTRPRGGSKAEDEALREELLRSEKDEAELIMIVDLLRNDLGKVCKYGSVKVEKLRVLEKHPTVFHTVSIIKGCLMDGYDRIDLLRACFPGGSITGAPKVRAMQIIDELEPTKRGIYTGSIGYLSFTGEMDLNIVIRSFFIKDGKAHFQIGGGIVADSDPEEEYMETLHKGKALIEAIKGGVKGEEKRYVSLYG